jgi:hypothetical protein
VATPDSVKDVMQSAFTSENFLPDFYNRSRYSFRIAFFYILAVLMYAGVAFGGRAAFISVYGRGGFVANLVGLLYLIAVPLWFRYICYIYDPMTVLLATWMLVTAARANVVWFAAVFLLACVNKETAPLALPVLLYAMSRRYHRYTVVGVGLGLLVAALFIHSFKMGFFDRPEVGGSWTEYHLNDHLPVLVTHFFMSFLYSFVVMGTLLWLTLTNVRRKPTILIVGFCFTFIPLFLASIPFGFVDEIRALYDAYPYVMLLAMPTVLALLNVPGVRENDGAPLEAAIA